MERSTPTPTNNNKPRTSTSDEIEFKAALLDFEIIKQENTIPEKMLAKLSYLENKLLGKNIQPHNFQALPNYELASLEECDHNIQMKLFTSIVRCLSGKETIIYFKDEKAYFRKDELLAHWKKCYISCDSQKVIIKKKIDQRSDWKTLNIKDMRVSVKYKEYKHKQCIGFIFEKKKYFIGFDLESACSRIHQVLRQLAKETQARQQRQREQQTLRNSFSNARYCEETNEPHHLPSTHRTFSKMKSDNMEEEQQEINEFTEVIRVRGRTQTLNSDNHHNNSILEFEKIANTLDDFDFGPGEIDLEAKHYEELNIFESEIKKETFSSDKNYKLIKNFELGRILLSEEEQKIKLSALMSLDAEFEWIFDQYLDMKSWNLEIHECRILNKLSFNSYRMLVVFKKYSMFSLSRWACVTVTAVEIDKKMYLLIRDYTSLTEEELVEELVDVGSVKMSFEQTLEICKRNNKDERILLTIITKANYSGYCSQADNISMCLKFLENIQNFYNYLLSQNIVSNRVGLFKFDKGLGENASDESFSKSEELSSRIKNKSIIFSEQSEEKESICSNDNDENYSQSEHFELQQQRQQKINKINKIHKKFETKQYICETQTTPRRIEECSKKETINTIINHNLNNNNSPEKIEEFLTLLKEYQTSDHGSDKFIKYIEEERIFETYALTHKFIINNNDLSNLSTLKKHPNTEEDNFITMKNKWKISKEEIIYIDQETLNQSKNVVKYILKQISSNVLAGKSIMNMSLPVEIFEKKSFLEKIADGLGFVPECFRRAANENNIVKQIELVAQAMMFNCTINPNIQKPFNPILGETFQCSIGGIDFYLEQTSHHPPISSYFMRTEEFELYGNFMAQVEMSLNSVSAKNQSYSIAKFHKTNTSYKILPPDYEMSGLMFGERKVRMINRGLVFEERNEVLLEMSFGRVKKNVYESSRKLRNGEIIGGIFKVSPGFAQRMKKYDGSKDFEGLKYDEKVEVLGKITGSWLGEMFVDEVKVKGMLDPAPYVALNKTYVLPSDCSFRLDSYYKRVGDLKKSQEQKEYLENLQRKDRKLREEYHKRSTLR